LWWFNYINEVVMLAIIGGTGFYELDGLSINSVEEVRTPYGIPSAQISIGKIGKNNIAFLPRHGRGHALLPSEINYQANIYALKAIGATQVLSISAVGSLTEELAPGDVALPSQYLDFTKGKRETTFFGDGLVGHVSTAVPVCEKLAAAVVDVGHATPEVKIHTGVTYACVEGPRLGTRAESFFLRGTGAHLVGMTNVPEVFLACEAQIAYASLCIVTDYDSWHDDPSHHATVAQVIKRYKETAFKVQKLVSTLLAGELPSRTKAQAKTLESAILTPEEFLTPEKKQLLAILRR
jgi:5'-methylthioadenosine phosphorylase